MNLALWREFTMWNDWNPRFNISYYFTPAINDSKAWMGITCCVFCLKEGRVHILTIRTFTGWDDHIVKHIYTKHVSQGLSLSESGWSFTMPESLMKGTLLRELPWIVPHKPKRPNSYWLNKVEYTMRFSIILVGWLGMVMSLGLPE